MKGRLASSLVLACLLPPAAAQDPLRVWTGLEPDVARTLERRLEGAARFASLAPGELAQRADGEGSADLFLAVPFGELVEWGGPDRLAVPPPTTLQAGLEPFALDESGRMLVAHGRAWVFVHDVERLQPRPAAGLDYLLEEDCRGLVTLLEPEAAPGLWSALRERQILDDRPPEAWLALLDSRVSGYAGDRQELFRLLAERQGAVTMLPLGSVGGGGRLGVTVPRAAPVVGLASALPAGLPEARRAAAYELLLRALGSELRLELARVHGVVPLPLADLKTESLQPELQQVLTRGWTVELGAEPLGEWLPHWSEQIRGQGREQEQFELILDWIFTLAFVGFLIVVYQRLKRSEG